MYLLCFLSFLLSAALASQAAEPMLLVPRGAGDGWANPVYSLDGRSIAFTNASESEIRYWALGIKEPQQVAAAAGIGRRFIFEPGEPDRVVYRQRVQALPGQPERLISTSLYIYDPAVRTKNFDPNIFGPYIFDHTVWYRHSLQEPFLTYQDSVRMAGPYMHWEEGHFFVLSARGDTLFTSQPGQVFAGMEISPDGKWVAAVQARPQREVFVIHLADGKLARQLQGIAPAWSGDSRKLAYVGEEKSGLRDLRIVDLASQSEKIILQSEQHSPQTPALNPDGTRAAFISSGAIWEVAAE